MKLAIFDIFAPYAFFKLPEGTRSSYSFPFPPKTAVIGLLAGIMGENRNEYWKENSKYLELKIGIENLSVPDIEPMKMNFWRSKNTITVDGYKFVLPGSDASSRGYTTQVKIDYLKNVKYRIFLGFNNLPDWDDLLERLKSHRYFYPPYLGHANLLAEINYIGLFDANFITEGNFSTIVPKSALGNEIINDFSEMGSFKVIYSVPVAYKTQEITINEYSRWNNTPFGTESFIIPPFSQSLSLILKEGFGLSFFFENNERHICVF